MITIFKNTFLTVRFFILGATVIVLLAIGFGFPLLLPVAKIALFLLVVAAVADLLLVFGLKHPVICSRTMAKILSLGSSNSIRIHLENTSGLRLYINIIDEQPAQLQDRGFLMKIALKPNEQKMLVYTIKPLLRGEYCFGNIHTFIQTKLGLIQRRISHEAAIAVPVFPSIIQMKELELRAITKISNFQGEKKMKRMGQSYEFEQIKNYVRGDDYRSINWKATGRKGDIMVNTYVDERSQQIYSVIDNSRVMRMPFEGLSLLDYAINSTLAVSNVALIKQDKAGLLVFSDKISSFTKAESVRGQMGKLSENLYNIEERNIEANYEQLYLSLRNTVKNRSLIMLYTNFESIYALQRVLPILRKINRLHLLVVVFFENTEIAEFCKQETKTTEDIYFQTIAQLFVSEKTQIVQQLTQIGIQTILTKPKDLSVKTLNKYLELKSRGLI